MQENQTAEVTSENRKALIRYPQSKPGKAIFYAVFIFQVLAEVHKTFNLPNGAPISVITGRDILGLLIDILTGVAPNILVVWAIRWGMVKARALTPSPTHMAYGKRFVGILTIVFILSVTVHFLGFRFSI